MRPEDAALDFLPPEVLAWADNHRELLEVVVEDILRGGEWPTASKLSRQFAREGRAVPVTTILSSMPRAIGFVENHPGRIVLLVFGVRLTRAGQELLAGFLEVLQIAIERYCGIEPEAVVRRSDLAEGGGRDNRYVRALSEILLREAPFLGSGSGGPDDDWSREITDDVVRYWDARSPDDYLRIRAVEVLPSQQRMARRGQANMLPPRASPVAVAGATQGAGRDVFISHAREDKDAVARPIAVELVRRGHTVWFDEYEFVLGDSLRQKIDQGLAHSTIGVVVLSHAFFLKQWPQRELDGLVARLMAGEENVIVPIWHQLMEHDLLRYSPPLADLLAGNSADGVESLVDQIERVLERRRSGVHRAVESNLDAGGEIRGGEIRGGGAVSSLSKNALGRAVEYLNEDARRWIQERDDLLSRQTAWQMQAIRSRGRLGEIRKLQVLEALRRNALQEYCEELSRMRRRYRELRAAATDALELPRFELDDRSREILADWRSPVKIPGTSGELPVDDPTAASLEPELREFETRGDGPKPRGVGET